ncbi:hypothetical protein BT93_C1091 [Corymbia citriodora subsp. variegata]|nr:hypothetical protein BT93_C1091 [Corymbia citriodora subsp. variegata]
MGQVGPISPPTIIPSIQRERPLASSTVIAPPVIRESPVSDPIRNRRTNRAPGGPPEPNPSSPRNPHWFSLLLPIHCFFCFLGAAALRTHLSLSLSLSLSSEGQGEKASTLAEQYLLEKVEKLDVVAKPDNVPEPEKPVNAASEEAVSEKAEVKDNSAAGAETSVTEETSSATVPDASADNTEDVSAVASAETAPPAEESNEANEEDNSSNEEAAEEAPEIQIETAPADFRFPTTNQTRHCFTRYVEYHRCIAAKGEDAQECEKFAKYYRSLCPGEWIDRWNEQRENGTFPGPL